MDTLDEAYRDKRVYVPQEMRTYGDAFLAYVDPHFVQDMEKNRGWYQENSS